MSFHHLVPELFGGAERRADGVLLATAEKALVDMAWLGSARSRLFSAVPELDLPKGFRRQAVTAWIRRVDSPKGRVQLERAWQRLVHQARS